PGPPSPAPRSPVPPSCRTPGSSPQRQTSPHDTWRPQTPSGRAPGLSSPARTEASAEAGGSEPPARFGQGDPGGPGGVDGTARRPSGPGGPRRPKRNRTLFGDSRGSSRTPVPPHDREVRLRPALGELGLGELRVHLDLARLDGFDLPAVGE